VTSLVGERVGGIVLCGGQSARMGRPKLSLPFGDETLLGRVVRIVGEVVSPVVVVAAAGQELPALPGGTIVTRDEIEAHGPLAGLAAGLATLCDRADAAYVSSCDVPLLEPRLIRALIAALGRHEVAVARDAGRLHPLAAVYRTACEGRVREFLAAGRLGLTQFVGQCDARLVDEAELRVVDPELRSLCNVNTPAEYEAALRVAGFAAA
jgi:molybdopterin-guanine dinucleotide biosynthesis protein A